MTKKTKEDDRVVATLNNEKIKLIGRYYQNAESLRCEFTASGFEFRAHLSGKIKINCKVDESSDCKMCHVGIIVNGDFENMSDLCLKVGETSFIAADDLAEGEYLVRIVKLDEFSKTRIDFFSIEFDGELLDKPADRPLKFEFYGDSITCGYGALSKTRETPNPFPALEHGYRTYAALLANHFGAELTVVAASGNGILCDFGGGPNVLRNYYDKAAPVENIKWDFRKYTPDAVFFNIGTNDYSFAKNSKTVADSDALANELESIVSDVVSHYPGCKLFFVYGINDAPLKCEYADIPSVYERLHEKFKNSYIITDIACNQLGGDWHPSVEDHKLVFDKIMAHFKEQNISF